MSKKKLWIILSSIIAVCVIVAAVLVCIFVFGDDRSSDHTDDQGSDDNVNNEIEYDFDIKGSAVLLIPNQTAKIPQAGENLSYSSADTSVAKVDANGIVTAVDVGETKVTCRDNDGNSHEYDVFVSKTVYDGAFTSPNTDETALACGNNRIAAGEYAAVPIFLVNNRGVSAFSLRLSYDSQLFTLKAVGPAGKGVDSVQFLDDGKGDVRIVGISHSVNGIEESDGELFYLYFTTKQGVSSGKSALSLSMGEGDMLVSVSHSSEVTLEAKMYNGSIVIVK